MSGSAQSGEAPVDRWRDLGTRAVASAVLVPLALLVTWAGGVWFMALLAAAGVTMAVEWCRMVHGGSPVQTALHASAALLAAAAPAGLVPMPVVLAALVCAWIVSMLVAGRTGALTGWALAGIAYVSLPILALGLLRHGASGLTAVVWLMLTVWSADIAAYFAGRIIGGRKLAPRISPKKTWAGLGGAVAGAMAASLAVWLAAGLDNPAAALALGGLAGFVEQMGDLFESAAKRSSGMKDSGNLIPGHGGLLDRIDGLVAAAMVAAAIGALHSGSGDIAGGLLQW